MHLVGQFLIFMLVINATVFALECYVCDEQEENNDKCSKTVKQCNETEDTCLSYIFWTSPQEMTPRGERRHYLSKSCATSDYCQKMLYAFTPVCTRNWYDDWSCVECCKGDRCNKYVFLGASSLSTSFLLTSIASFISTIFLIYY
ncbi:unnamed protein product [Brachionus calyciflorus]|uniref:Uncharacterized protein n=1 Tax=Brachionus calyciflorus TaxID=104777 RepID=A0A814BKN0_9BILA|nr:unnamed protein product [Brachionus calyciflorus]